MVHDVSCVACRLRNGTYVTIRHAWLVFAAISKRVMFILPCSYELYLFYLRQLSRSDGSL